MQLFAALALAALLVAAGPSTAQNAPQPLAQAPDAPQTKPSASRGEAVFRGRCGLCHKDPKAFGKRFKLPTATVRGTPLDAYLAKHHAPDPVPRRDVIAFLQSL